MDTLFRELALEMTIKGISKQDGIMAMQCLESEKQFQKLLNEAKKVDSMNREAILALAVLIAENEL